AVEARLAQLQTLAGLHEGLDAAERGFGAAQREMWHIQQQGGAAARAAEATPWWRPGQRERLEAEAGQYAARYEQAKTDVAGWREQLGERADRLREHTGGHRANPQWAREQLDRAQAASATERAAAQQRDEAALAALHQRVAAQHAAAEKAGGRHGEVLAEQQHRAQLEPLDRAQESGWRLDELIAQMRERQQTHSERGRATDDDVLGYGYRSRSHDQGLDHGRDQDHGFGMGR
ncbi:MAG: hypothetical protein L0H64_23335, partial [Pseudonocardia sp.]|nr:hypothetical protein [Pseudonocardia sp.]